MTWDKCTLISVSCIKPTVYICLLYFVIIIYFPNQNVKQLIVPQINCLIRKQEETLKYHHRLHANVSVKYVRRIQRWSCVSILFHEVLAIFVEVHWCTLNDKISGSVSQIVYPLLSITRLFLQILLSSTYIIKVILSHRILNIIGFKQIFETLQVPTYILHVCYHWRITAYKWKSTLWKCNLCH